MKNTKKFRVWLAALASLIILFSSGCGSDDSSSDDPSSPPPPPKPNPIQLGTPEDDQARAVTVDVSGDIYVAGYTKGGLYEHDNSSDGTEDAFLLKYNGGGDKLNSWQIGTTSSDMAEAVVTDSTGNVYVVGHTTGPLGFTPKDYEHKDIFLIKYKKVGKEVVKQWTWQMSAPTSYHHVNDAAVDSTGNVYIAGNTDTDPASGGEKMLLVKYEAGGIRQPNPEVFSERTESDSKAEAVAVDSSDNVYIAGHTASGLFGPNPGGSDIILIKTKCGTANSCFDTNGNHLWTKQLGGSFTSSVYKAYSVVVDSSNNVYIAGTASGDLDDEAKNSDRDLNLESYGQGYHGGIDIFLIKFDSTGDDKWVRQIGDVSDDHATSMAVDSSDNVYVVGYTTDDLDEADNIEPKGGDDVIIIKFNRDGEVLWKNQIGSDGDDQAHSVAVDADNVYVVGHTKGLFEGNIIEGRRNSDIFKAVFNKKDGTLR